MDADGAGCARRMVTRPGQGCAGCDEGGWNRRGRWCRQRGRTRSASRAVDGANDDACAARNTNATVVSVFAVDTVAGTAHQPSAAGSRCRHCTRDLLAVTAAHVAADAAASHSRYRPRRRAAADDTRTRVHTDRRAGIDRGARRAAAECAGNLAQHRRKHRALDHARRSEPRATSCGSGWIVRADGRRRRTCRGCGAITRCGWCGERGRVRCGCAGRCHRWRYCFFKRRCTWCSGRAGGCRAIGHGSERSDADLQRTECICRIGCEHPTARCSCRRVEPSCVDCGDGSGRVVYCDDGRCGSRRGNDAFRDSSDYAVVRRLIG